MPKVRLPDGDDDEDRARSTDTIVARTVSADLTGHRNAGAEQGAVAVELKVLGASSKPTSNPLHDDYEGESSLDFAAGEIFAALGPAST